MKICKRQIENRQIKMEKEYNEVRNLGKNLQKQDKEEQWKILYQIKENGTKRKLSMKENEDK